MDIIRSGADEDGASGLVAIHHSGGVTIVQDQGSAQVPITGLSALKRWPPDFVRSHAAVTRALPTNETPASQPIPKDV